MNDATKTLVDAKTLCREIGVTPKTLTLWIRQGRFPAPMRLGLRKRVWLRVTIDSFYEQAAESGKENIQ